MMKSDGTRKKTDGLGGGVPMFQAFIYSGRVQYSITQSITLFGNAHILTALF